ncbi:MAG: protein kinase [Pirellulaceae bacterium]
MKVWKACIAWPLAKAPSRPLSTHDPRRLGDFELHKEIGRGGMGVVYRATQTSLHRTVAIKLLPLTSVLDSRQLTRFQHEAEAAASLQHPNIVPVYAVGCERGIHFYAMQFIQGSAMGAATVEARDVRESNSDSSQVSATSDWRTAVARRAELPMACMLLTNSASFTAT